MTWFDERFLTKAVHVHCPVAVFHCDHLNNAHMLYCAQVTIYINKVTHMYLCGFMVCVAARSLVLYRIQHLCIQISQKTKADMTVMHNSSTVTYSSVIYQEEKK